MPTLVVNGEERSYDGDPDMPLLWYLRDELGLTGTKFGCGVALCGACTVHLDGAAVRSCQTPMSAAIGTKITTIEGLDRRTATTRCRRPGASSTSPQCGYCQAGQIMQAAALLQGHAEPERRGHRRRHERQHLPLRHLPAHPRRDQAGRDQGAAAMTDTTASCSRTSAGAAFLGGVAAGALVPRVAAARRGRARRSRSSAPTACRNGWRDDPLIFVAIAPDGIVIVICTAPRWARASALGADDRRRRARRRLGEGPRRAGAGDERATATRTPTARARMRDFFSRCAAPAPRRA